MLDVRHKQRALRVKIESLREQLDDRPELPSTPGTSATVWQKLPTCTVDTKPAKPNSSILFWTSTSPNHPRVDRTALRCQALQPLDRVALPACVRQAQFTSALRCCLT